MVLVSSSRPAVFNSGSPSNSLPVCCWITCAKSNTSSCERKLIFVFVFYNQPHGLVLSAFQSLPACSPDLLVDFFHYGLHCIIFNILYEFLTEQVLAFYGMSKIIEGVGCRITGAMWSSGHVTHLLTKPSFFLEWKVVETTLRIKGHSVCVHTSYRMPWSRHGQSAGITHTPSVFR